MRSMIYNAPIIDRTLEPRVTHSLACAPAGSADVATDSMTWSTVSRPLFDASQASELHGYFSMEPQEVGSADQSITTSAVVIAERYAHSAYGEPTILDRSGAQIANSSINNRYSHSGREWDEANCLREAMAKALVSAVRSVASDPNTVSENMGWYTPVVDTNAQPVGWPWKPTT